ncbi:MAG TPA: hypothetical protein VFW81_01765 [Thermoanaerobaculia bacterium]|nr:hypothetical protein [Thermoanaerobaculia bacterium]
MIAAVAALALLLASPAAASPSGISSVGRDVVVTEKVPGRIVAVAADVRVESAVAGDVIVWGGDVSFGPAGTVAGNLVVFGGTIRGVPGRALPVGGTVSTPGTLLRLYLAEMKRAPWEPGALTPVVWGLRLLALSAWLAVAVALLYFFGSPLARAADRAESNWTGALTAGVLGVLTIFLAAAAALALLPSAVAVPVALALASAAIAAKVFGMGALFLLLGQKLTASFSPGRRPSALAVGFAVLGGLSLLPVAGPIVWSAASVAAVGVAFVSRFGAPNVRVALRAI